MEFLDLLAKPIQIAKDVLDLNDDLESPSLASQFVAIKHQLDEVQRQLDESHRISHEKDLVISKLQRAMSAKAEPRPSTPAFVRHDEESAPATPVREREAAVPVLARHAPVNRPQAPTQTDPDEEIKLPGAPSYEAAAQRARSQCPGTAAKATPAPAEPESSASAATPAKAEKTETTRRARKAVKAGAVTATVAKAKKTTRAGKQTTTSAAKPARTRATAKKSRTATESKAAPKKSARTTKRATAKQAEPASKRPAAKTKARKTTASKRNSRATKS